MTIRDGASRIGERHSLDARPRRLPRNALSGPTPDDVTRAIYAAEGWTITKGESSVIRCAALYDIVAYDRRNRYTAKRR